MFTLAIDPTYPHRVTGALPGGAAFEFECHFKRLSPAQVDALVGRARAGELQDAGLVREVLVGWSDVCDESGTQLPFSAESRDRVLEIYGVAAGIVRGWFDSLAGAREKN